MFSPFGNGHHLGATPGTWEEPGDRSLHGYLAPAGGALCQQRPGDWPAGAARPGKALHLIHGGASPDSARPGCPGWHRHGTPQPPEMRHRDGPRL